MIMPERFNSVSKPSKMPIVPKELTSITSFVLTHSTVGKEQTESKNL